ncbi:MAG: ABC transporter permease [Candidatus Krumholzibacteriia bacterium]
MPTGHDREPLPPIPRIWGGAIGLLHHSRRLRAVDFVVVLGAAGLLYGIMGLAREWHGTIRPTVAIDLSPLALPRYTLLSLSRGLAAYLLSLGFTLTYGYWAAKDRVAERILVPLLDILQSIPVLGFMPGVVLALVALFPRTNTGLELAAVLMIFTGQVWNMTFSFYHSLRSVPADLDEATTLFRFGWWQRLRSVELPFATLGLVWNSMMSMAGGWFFLMISETFVLGKQDFRLPGLGSYMSVAVAQGDIPAMIRAILAMVAMILFLDQFLWRPIVVWARKFRVEESSAQDATGSWVLDQIRRSRLLRRFAERRERSGRRPAGPTPAPAPATGPRRAAGPAPAARRARPLTLALSLLLLAALGFAGWKLVDLIRRFPAGDWAAVFGAAGLTLGRVLITVVLGTVWALPAGLAIGLSPRLSRVLQPVVQVVASFPAPMLFPAAIAVLSACGVSIGLGSIVLMLLGTQWYILFNVIAGAMAVPSDLREAARSFRLRGWRLFRALLLPAVFPYLVTGWVTAAGGAWNASIVSEYVTYKGHVLAAHGLGAEISRAAEQADFRRLAACIAVMALVVVFFNRVLWQRLYRLGERRFSLGR